MRTGQTQASTKEIPSMSKFNFSPDNMEETKKLADLGDALIKELQDDLDQSSSDAKPLDPYRKITFVPTFEDVEYEVGKPSKKFKVKLSASNIKPITKTFNINVSSTIFSN
jgi:hypothetical protein